MAEPVSVAVLLSGRGSNLVALAEYKRRDPARAYRIVLVASNQPDARGLIAARALGLPTWAHSHKGIDRTEFDLMVDEAVRERGGEVIALAGYMRLLSGKFVARWPRRILNIHPSLLPRHKGLDTHRRALIAGDSEAGCSIHLVTDELDSGPVLARRAIRIHARDDPESLGARVLEAEHALYPQALEDFCRRLQATGDQPVISSGEKK